MQNSLFIHSLFIDLLFSMEHKRKILQNVHAFLLFVAFYAVAMNRAFRLQKGCKTPQSIINIEVYVLCCVSPIS